jgi:hypothetical protein
MTSVPGRIVVHDRAQVESQILPRYFNHASFASLRRQLNYFAFSREGKGKQKGATYINDQVYDLDDILHLKRRLPGTAGTVVSNTTTENESLEGKTNHNVETSITAVTLDKPIAKISHTSNKRSAQAKKQHSKKVRKILESSVPVVHLPKKKAKRTVYLKTSRDSNVAPTISPSPPARSGEKPISTPTILLDLTRPEAGNRSISTTTAVMDLKKPQYEVSSTASASSGSSRAHQENSFIFPRPKVVTQNVWFNIPTMPIYQETQKEEDILAGCSALLSLGWQR